MGIEWGNTGFSSRMDCRVLDDTGRQPDHVLQENQAFRINVTWEVPAPLAGFMGAGDTFRVRAYAESIGPGQEIQISQATVNAVNGQVPYDMNLVVPAGTLQGEGRVFSGVEVSGAYQIVCVLQHLQGGAQTVHAGMVEYPMLVQIKQPN